uniref:Reverse transcriptase domain-containing protein n=1 Tax=Anopheles funestus TaxID=62324 RepID=A0A182R3Y0_ANOFN
MEPEMLSYNITTININNISNANKLEALKSFVYALESDIVFIQELEDEHISISGYEIITNIDIARRGTAIALKHGIKITNIARSPDSRIIVMRINDTVTLCNVYAPSGSHNRKERENFYNHTLAYYLQNSTQNLIMAGDFNCVVHDKDSTGNNNNSEALKGTIQALKLKDTWELLKGNMVEYSYITSNSASRLDRIYVSEKLKSNTKEKIVELKEKRKSGLLISFDLSQAFDRVDRRFLFQSMIDLGFNENLINLLQNLANLGHSKILINNKLTDSILIEKSVRQGDPLSMLLFNIYLNPLLEKIVKSCKNEHECINAYADDISLIATCKQTVEDVKNHFLMFEKEAGAKINLKKTQATDIGYITTNNTINVPWLKTSISIKLLGVKFLNSIRLMAKNNWRDAIRKCAQLIWINKSRSLNLIQKVIVCNTFILSKIWYIASIFPPQKQQMKTITRMITSFIWNRRPIKVAIDQLSLKKSEGGLNLAIPTTKCKALLINRYIQEKECLTISKRHIESIANPPFIKTIEIDDICTREIVKEMAYMPKTLMQNSTSKSIYEYLKNNSKKPLKIENKFPQCKWEYVWHNIHKNNLGTEEKSILYLMANEKMPPRETLQKLGLADDAFCSTCTNIIEDIEHKFVTCPKVIQSWKDIERT